MTHLGHKTWPYLNVSSSGLLLCVGGSASRCRNPLCDVKYCSGILDQSLIDVAIRRPDNILGGDGCGLCTYHHGERYNNTHVSGTVSRRPQLYSHCFFVALLILLSKRHVVLFPPLKGLWVSHIPLTDQQIY